MDQPGIIPKGSDGYYHPKNENEVVALVKYAVKNKLQIRARGASHSTAHSIFTDPVNGKPENMTLTTAPPAGPNLNLAMDGMIELDWIDKDQGIVEAGAGIHLGLDPYDSIGTSTLENSLLHQLFQKGWGLNDLGGITHQTISGFTATGSSGGSLIYELDNVIGFRVVDGTGHAEWVEAADRIFPAMSVSVGLLGIVTKVRLKLNKTFYVIGTEATTPPTGPDSPIDLFGPGDGARPSLRKFLEEAPYSRIMWWPQQGGQRIVVWRADRTENPPPEPLKPYEEFTIDLKGWLMQLLGSVFFVLLGNTDRGQIGAKLRRNYARFLDCVALMWSKKLGLLAWPLAAIVTALAAFVLLLPTLIFMAKREWLTGLFPFALGLLQPMTVKDGPKTFADHYWRSLPMDNTADDVLLGTEFTEIWIPIQYTQQCMNLFNDLFNAPDSPAVGYYSTEIYGTKANSHWLSPAYSDGNDEYQDGVVRFDVFWFRGNEGQPNVEDGFYRQYWDMLRANNIPFRFHWGKFIPAYDFQNWADFYRASWPKFDDFMRVRQERDPDGVFFTEYWRKRLTGHA
jgi:hypothetical protein